MWLKFAGARVGMQQAFALLAVAVLFSGVRFSDGNILLEIASGANPNSPFFASHPFSQYIFDSPLKVWLLRSLPANIIFIASLFAVITVSPLLLLTGGVLDARAKNAFLLFLICAPVIKILFQNVGVGDGLTLLLTTLMVFSSLPPLNVPGFLILGLWHPQQTFFIFVSYSLAQWAFSEAGWRAKVAWALAGCVAAFVIYLAYRIYGGSGFTGRVDYVLLVTRGPLAEEVFKGLLLLLQMGVLGAAVNISPRMINMHKMLIVVCWLAVVVVIGAITTDFTRVFFLVTAPLWLLALYHRPLEWNWRVASAIAVCMLLPNASWSGLDIFLYSDVIQDLCKWQLICI